MVKNLIENMTLLEKVGQLNQRLYGWKIFHKNNGKIELTEYFKNEVEKFQGIGFVYGAFRADPWSEIDFLKGLTKDESRQLVEKVQKYLSENTRLGIPAAFSEECPHGHQGLYSTTFPVNYTVGSSWNTELYSLAQEIVASEIREYGAHIGLISTLDVSRDPRWGRTEECFSEDPFLTGQFAKAALKGLQGEVSTKLAKNKVFATLKHFAAQGATIGGHNAGPTGIGERELFEIHLLPMLYAMEANPVLCMAAYNDIDGIPCHGNKNLLENKLRKQMGYKGLIMSDGVALERLVSLVNGDRALAAAWALDSGVDISLWDNVYPYLVEAIEKNYIDISKLNNAVYRVLKLKEKMGLFNNIPIFVESFSEQYKKKINKQLSQESVVMLKNDNNILPLEKNKIKKIALIGPNANSVYNQLGDYTPYKDGKKVSTIYDGLKKYTKNTNIEIEYSKGCEISSCIPFELEQAKKIAEKSDFVILVLGGSSARDFSTVFDDNGAALEGSKEMTSGENIDLSNIELSIAQQTLVREIYKRNKHIICLLVQGRPHSLVNIEDKVEAILNLGYPGELGGEAIAEILFGDVSPSGKLAITIPSSTGELPVFYNFKDNHHMYKYSNKETLSKYCFGFGLSYSTFELKNIKIEKNSSTLSELKVSGVLKNTGSIDAKEVIKVYLHANHEKTIPRIKELKGFKKIFVRAQDEEKFEINLSEKELSGLTDNMEFKLYQRIKIIVEVNDQEVESELTL